MLEGLKERWNEARADEAIARQEGKPSPLASSLRKIGSNIPEEEGAQPVAVPRSSVVGLGSLDNPSGLPSYDEGGDVDQDQIAKLSAGEKVLNPEEAKMYDENKQGIFGSMTAGPQPTEETVAQNRAEGLAPVPSAPDARMLPAGRQDRGTMMLTPEQIAAGSETGNVHTPEELRFQRNLINADKMDAAMKGDLIKLGTANVHEAELAKMNPWGTPHNHPGFLGKLGHGLARAGEIAADVFAPGVMTAVPGSRMNLAARERAGMGEMAEGERLAGERAGTEATQARTQQEQTQTRALQTNQALHNRLAEEGYSLNVDPNTGEQSLTRIPGWQESEKSIQSLYANAVKQALDAGQDPNKDPHVQQIREAIEATEKPEKLNDFEQFFQSTGLSNTPANRLKARKQWAESGQLPPQTIVMVPGQAPGTLQAVNVKPGSTVSAEAMKPGEQAQVSRKDIAAHDKAYVQPAEAVEKSYQMMDNAYREFQTARAQGRTLPTGAQSMLALSTHLATTFGNVKGSRITKDMIQEHLGARGISDKALVAVQRLTNGDVLSPDQWEAFHGLIGESRQLSWQTAVKEADRKHVPVDFLPNDLSPAYLRRPDKALGYIQKSDGRHYADKNGKDLGLVKE